MRFVSQHFQYPFVKISMGVFVVELFFFPNQSSSSKTKHFSKNRLKKMKPCLTGRTIGSPSRMYILPTFYHTKISIIHVGKPYLRFWEPKEINPGMNFYPVLWGLEWAAIKILTIRIPIPRISMWGKHSRDFIPSLIQALQLGHSENPY